MLKPLDGLMHNFFHSILYYINVSFAGAGVMAYTCVIHFMATIFERTAIIIIIKFSTETLTVWFQIHRQTSIALILPKVLVFITLGNNHRSTCLHQISEHWKYPYWCLYAIPSIWICTRTRIRICVFDNGKRYVWVSNMVAQKNQTHKGKWWNIIFVFD